MITKGVSDIRGIRDLNTGSRPNTESCGFLKLYQLSTEKDNLLKKTQWVRRQREQAEKRLFSIARTMNSIEKRTKREGVPSRTGFHSTFIKY
jgi:hypothetical protein